MKRQEIEQKVNTFLIDRLEIDEELVKPEANLKADLGLTSLDMQEMKIYCKRTFGFMPERQEILKLNVISDIVDLIVNRQV